MTDSKKRDILVLAVFLIFSIWFVGKSFGFDNVTKMFWVARHQVGDFGLHLALVRSISYGANFPMELPFYPGQPLAYHYGFDLLAGLLERAGVRVDIAINGLSAVALMFLFWGIYVFGRSLFRFDRISAALAALLSIVGGGFAALSAFLRSPSHPWLIPDYIYKGPFDGSSILIFFTPNVLLNQRHLIASLAIHVWILYVLLHRKKQHVLVGTLLGISLYFHSLLFFAGLFITIFLIVVRRQWRQLLYVLIPAITISLPHIIEMYSSLSTGGKHMWIRWGFLTPGPVTFLNVITFWWNNMGVTLLTIGFGLLLANKKQRLLFAPFLALFVLGNIVQFSFRPDHNHSLFNFIFIVGNLYTVLFLRYLWKKQKIAVFLLLILTTGSGLLNLMAVKNDFRYPLPELTSPFVSWVRKVTAPDSVFLSVPDIIDPVALAGRYNYLGSSYYLDVLGYSYKERQSVVSSADRMREAGIDYILIPKKPWPGFLTPVEGKIVYDDASYTVYAL